MTIPILATKLFLPPLRSEIVRRPRLYKQLNAGLSHKLTLISAPAGFGKSTLLSAWLQELGSSMLLAWFSLDQDDNDPSRFWFYMIAAIQTVQPSIGETAQAALQTTQAPPLSNLVAHLINDLSMVSKPFVLVLDDYHLIQDEEIHQSLNFFVDRLPPQIHLVIVTRENPPLTLSRWRGRAEMTEIRVADLRFTVAEADEFLNSISALSLATEDVNALENRTEGWAVGLHMAALSLQSLDAANKHEFITAFAGDDRYVMDYLVEEIIQHQPETVQDFLLQTSILERLSAPLCDALTERTDSRALLDELERANLFIIPLDNRRFWFRYHHLFSDLLQHRLHLARGTDFVHMLYLRASQWFEQEGLLDEAVSYALAAQDFEYAADVIERHVLNTFYRSETVLANKWLQSLPEEILRTRSLLSAVYASCVLLNRTDSPKNHESAAQVEKWLRTAEAALAVERHLAHPQAIHYIDKVRAYLTQLRWDDPENAIKITRQAIERLPAGELRFRSALAYNLGVCYRRSGDLNAAQTALTQAWQTGIASCDFFNAAAGVALLAHIARWQGQLKQAEEICQDGLRTIQERANGQPVPYTGIIDAQLGSILLERGQLQTAAEHLEKGITKLELTIAPNYLAFALVELAYIHQITDQITEAMGLIKQAERVSRKKYADIQAHRVKLWLRQARKDTSYLRTALEWAKLKQQLIDNQITNYNLEVFTLIRVALTQKWHGQQPAIISLDSVQSQLAVQLQLAKDSGSFPWELEILILQALTSYAQENPSAAFQKLNQALGLAAPQEYVHIFIGEGATMIELLHQARPNNPHAAYINHLCTQYAAWDANQRAPSPSAASSALLDPLSPRELEILQLIATGISNPEITQKLHISINTVKTHITHIFRKLDVSRRAQAIARARELGILD